VCKDCVPTWLYGVMDAFMRHYVIDDFNVEDHHIDWDLERMKPTEPAYGFLLWLKTVSLEERGITEED
jgi:hypothetical protein